MLDALQCQAFIYAFHLSDSTSTDFQSIDLFSSNVLFSHFRPRDATLGNSFFEMLSYAHAHVCITCEKTKAKFP